MDLFGSGLLIFVPCGLVYLCKVCRTYWIYKSCQLLLAICGLHTWSICFCPGRIIFVKLSGTYGGHGLTIVSP